MCDQIKNSKNYHKNNNYNNYWCCVKKKSEKYLDKNCETFVKENILTKNGLKLIIWNKKKLKKKLEENLEKYF